MNLMSGYKGVVGLVFGNESSASKEDSDVERLLDRINNGVIAEDRRNAIVELQSVVAESDAAQMAFGAMGFPVLTGVLKEERDDVEMIRGSLETFLTALTPVHHRNGARREIQPALMNAESLSCEAKNISLLIDLLTEEDFYVRYYILQILTALAVHSPNRLQEAILTIPHAMTQLMDMLLEREVIRNEALLLLTYLTKEAEEIQKIAVFEGAYDKIFNIIKEEGFSDGGVVVQDCIEFLNNLLRTNLSNQMLLRETLGFDPLISILNPQGKSSSFSQQKTTNLLTALESVNLIMMEDQESELDINKAINRDVLKHLMDSLFLLSIECLRASPVLRSSALRCLGDLVAGHPKNRDILANKCLGEEPQLEPALNSVLRIVLQASSLQEFFAADYVFKRFCEANPIGQEMLASTLIPQPHWMSHAPIQDDVKMSFGSMLLHGLSLGENDDLETCCRAASVLCHILKSNIHCKEKVLKIQLDSSTSAFESSEPLMHRLVKHFAVSTNMAKNDRKQTMVQAILLKLLITWMADFPNAVHCFLDQRHHLTFLLELLASPSAATWTKGLAAILLGECIVYKDSGKETPSVAASLNQKLGLDRYLLNLEELWKCDAFSLRPSHQQKKTGAIASAVVDSEDLYEQNASDHEDPVLFAVFDRDFVKFVKGMDTSIRERLAGACGGGSEAESSVFPGETEKRRGESEADFMGRLQVLLKKQYSEMQILRSQNAILSDNAAKLSRVDSFQPLSKKSQISDKLQIEALQREILETSNGIKKLKEESERIKSEASGYKNLAAKMESDLTSLSDAYNRLEQTNFKLEKELKELKAGNVEVVKAEAREEAQRESEAELNDLLVCLGQEESKVEKLSERLRELGEDVDGLLEGIGDDSRVIEDA